MFTVTILTVSAYTAIVVAVVYLIIYTRMFDWYKSSLGRVMNFSIISTIFIALGVVSRSFIPDEQVGRVISSAGWLVFSGLLMWRTRILIFAYHQLNDSTPVDGDPTLPPIRDPQDVDNGNKDVL